MTGIQVRTDDLGVKKVKAVETAHGTIETQCVVNCAGEMEARLSKIFQPQFILKPNKNYSYSLHRCLEILGVWATKLGDMAGVKVPLIAMHHAYVVTERIEGIQV